MHLFEINQTGLEFLKSDHDVITKKTLKRFGNYSSIDKKIIPQDNKIDEEKTEEEEFEVLKDQYVERIQLELLQHIKNRCSSSGFEKLCLKLLEEMGYGESKHTGKSGDRGVDGIIYVDKLGLKKIYVQTKKHDQRTISYEEVAGFYGKCVRDKVQGIFITTSNFSDNTIDEMERESIIKLIHGTELVKYLYQFNVGVELESKIELKQINIDELDSFN